MKKKELRDFNLLEKLEKSIGYLKDVGFREDSLDFKIKINPEDGSVLIQLRSKGVRDIMEKAYNEIPPESSGNCVNTISFLKKGILLKGLLSKDSLDVALGTFNWIIKLAVNKLREKQEKLRRKINNFFEDKEIKVTKISIYFSEAQWYVVIQAGNISISLSHPKLEKIFSLADKIA